MVTEPEATRPHTSESSSPPSALPSRTRRAPELSIPSTGPRRHKDHRVRYEEDVEQPNPSGGTTPELQIDQYGPRVGVPRLPSHPPRFEHAKSNKYPAGWTPDISVHIGRLCDDLRVRYDDIALTYRGARHDPSVDRELCLVIYAHLSEISVWPALCRSVFSYLEEKEMILPVEIIDWQASIDELNFPLLSPRSPMIFVWPEIRPQVLEILADKDWLTMTVYGSSGSTVPVIVLGVWSPRDQVWLESHPASVMSRMTSLCDSYRVSTHIIVSQAYNI